MKRYASVRLSIIGIILLISALSGCGGGSGSSSSLLPSSGTQGGSINPPQGIFPPTTPPPVPVIATAKAFTDRVELDWSDTSIQEDGFTIERDGIEVAKTPRNISVYTDTNIQPGTTYCYAVRSYNVVGKSNASAQECATVPLPPAPIPSKWILAEGASIRSLAIDQATGELYAAGEIAKNMPNGIDNDAILVKLNPDGAQACAKQWGTDTYDVVFDIAVYNGAAYVLWSDITGNETVSVFDAICGELSSLNIGHLSAVHIVIDQSGIYFNNGIKMDLQGTIISWGPSFLNIGIDDVAAYNDRAYYAGALRPTAGTNSWYYDEYVAAVDGATNSTTWISNWGKQEAALAFAHTITAGAYGVYTFGADITVVRHDLNGNVLWTYKDTTQSVMFVSHIVADNDGVYVIGKTDLIKINAADGTVVWRTVVFTDGDFKYLAIFNNVLFVAKGHSNIIRRYDALTGSALP